MPADWLQNYSGPFLESPGNLSGPWSHLEPCDYRAVLNRGSLHTRSFRRLHFSVFRCRSTENGFTDPECFRGFRETGPRRKIHLKSDMSHAIISEQLYIFWASAWKAIFLFKKECIKHTGKRGTLTANVWSVDSFILEFKLCFYFLLLFRLPLWICLPILLPRDHVRASYRS